MGHYRPTCNWASPSGERKERRGKKTTTNGIWIMWFTVIFDGFNFEDNCGTGLNDSCTSGATCKIDGIWRDKHQTCGQKQKKRVGTTLV